MEDLIPVLTRFHRDVVLPDIKRVVADEVGAAEQRLRNEMQTALDGITRALKDLRQEHHMLVAGVKRVEERLDRLEQRMERIEKGMEKAALRSELTELKSRVDVLQEQVRTLEARLDA